MGYTTRTVPRTPSVICRICKTPIALWSDAGAPPVDQAHSRCEIDQLFDQCKRWPRTGDRGEEIKRLERIAPKKDWRAQWGSWVPEAPEAPYGEVRHLDMRSDEPGTQMLRTHGGGSGGDRVGVAVAQVNAPRGRFRAQQVPAGPVRIVYTAFCKYPGCEEREDLDGGREALYWMVKHRQKNPGHPNQSYVAREVPRSPRPPSR